MLWTIKKDSSSDLNEVETVIAMMASPFKSFGMNMASNWEFFNYFQKKEALDILKLNIFFNEPTKCLKWINFQTITVGSR